MPSKYAPDDDGQPMKAIRGLEPCGREQREGQRLARNKRKKPGEGAGKAGREKTIRIHLLSTRIHHVSDVTP